MRLRTWYKIHKWVSISMALALLVWLFTGLVMVLPRSEFARSGGRAPAVDYDSMLVSPAQAVARARALAGNSPEVRDLGLTRVIDRLVYRVTPANGRPLMIDARTGDRLELTAQLAVDIAKASLGRPVGVEQVDHITEHSLRYPSGPLPVYRVRFGGELVVYVSEREGTVVSRSNPRDRFKSMNGNLHGFGLLRLGPGGPATQHGLIWLFGVGSIMTLLTGLYLALPKRWKVRRRPPTHGAAHARQT